MHLGNDSWLRLCDEMSDALEAYRAAVNVLAANHLSVAAQVRVQRNASSLVREWLSDLQDHGDIEVRSPDVERLVSSPEEEPEEEAAWVDQSAPVQAVSSLAEASDAGSADMADSLIQFGSDLVEDDSEEDDLPDYLKPVSSDEELVFVDDSESELVAIDFEDEDEVSFISFDRAEPSSDHEPALDDSNSEISLIPIEDDDSEVSLIPVKGDDSETSVARNRSSESSDDEATAGHEALVEVQIEEDDDIALVQIEEEDDDLVLGVDEVETPAPVGGHRESAASRSGWSPAEPESTREGIDNARAAAPPPPSFDRSASVKAEPRPNGARPRRRTAGGRPAKSRPAPARVQVGGDNTRGARPTTPPKSDPAETLELGEAEEEIGGTGGMSLEQVELVEYEEEEYELASLEPDPPTMPPVAEEEARLIALAESAFNSGDLQAATQFYTDALDFNPDNGAVILARGRIFLDLGEDSRALSDFQSAEDLLGRTADLECATGELFYNRKDYHRATEHFNAAITMDERYALAWCRRGITRYHQKQYREAVADLAHAKTLDPEIPNIDMYIRMAKKKAT